MNHTKNKKIMKKILFILISIGMLVSCTKDEVRKVNDTPESSIPAFLKSSTQDGNKDAYINIIANDYTFASVHPINITIDGYFKNDNNLSFINSFQLENINIPTIDNEIPQYYNFLSGIHNNIVNYSNIKGQMGKTANLSIDGGTNFPSFSQDIELPKIMQLINFPIQDVSKTNDLTITWEVDSEGDQIAILLLYQKNRSIKDNPNLPNKDISIIKYVDESLGNVIFSATELSKFPTNGICTIFIGRGTRTEILKDEKEILVNAVSYQMTDDFIFVE